MPEAADDQKQKEGIVREETLLSLRFSELVVSAKEVFGDERSAFAWLHVRIDALQQELDRLEHGVFFSPGRAEPNKRGE
jgi:hypothetical protein